LQFIADIMMTSTNTKYAAFAGVGLVVGLAAPLLSKLWKRSVSGSADRSSYKLIYFNSRGRAEVSRLLFNIANVKFEDARFPIDPQTFKHVEFDAQKNTFPFKQLPVLEVDGVQVPQSHAIERYLARKFDMLGDSDVEAACIEAACEQMVDIFALYRKAKDAKEDKKWLEEKLPGQFALLDELAKKGSGEWLVGRRMSLADVFFFNMCGNWDNQEAVNAALQSCQTLRAIKLKVEQHEAVAHWVSIRPKTAF